MFLNRERNVFRLREECLFNSDYEKLYFHFVGGENDDKVSKVRTCSLSPGSFVLASRGRRKLSLKL
jgi:hypothetical protein